MTELEIVETGEVIQPMSAEEASSITTQIAVKLDTIADNYQAVMPLIREALTRQAHLALGYAAPGAYVADRFGRALERMATGPRRAFVAELTNAGMSTRQIAPIFVVDPSQISRDRQVLRSATPDPQAPPPTIPQGEPVSRDVGGGSTELDRRHDLAVVAEFGVDLDEPVLTQEDCEALDDAESDELAERIAAELAASDWDPPINAEPVVEIPAPRITGTDGKSYPAPKPSNPRRSPLPESVDRAMHDLRKRTESLTRWIADDRFPANRAGITQKQWSGAIDALKHVTAFVVALDPAVVTETEEARQWWLTSLSEPAEALQRLVDTLQEEK